MTNDYRQTLETVLGVPFSEGNSVKPLKNGIEIFPKMLEAISAAQRNIDFLTFVYWTGDIAKEFASALSERAQSGVKIRVILDAFGAKSMPPEVLSQMLGAGIDVQWFRSFTRWKFWQIQHRTHRKILVVDGLVGFTGGVGIASEWEGNARNKNEWRETHFQIEGPSLRGLQAAFLANWYEACDEITYFEEPTTEARPGDTLVQVVQSTATIGRSPIELLFRHLVDTAQHQINLTTAYFVPDERMISALIRASGRGIKIQILIPGKHIDFRVAQQAGEAAYAPLLKAGIKIWRYQPTMIHAKIMTVDHTVAVIGSANFNQRSMSKDDETNLVVIDPDLVAELERDFEADQTRSQEFFPNKWRKRGIIQRIKETISRPFRNHS